MKHAYVSELGNFLAQLDRLYPVKSSSQQAEITAYERIFYLRDYKVEQPPQALEALWSEF